MRVAEIVGAPFTSVLLKIYTNQGIVGLGEVRDGASATYALMLKRPTDHWDNEYSWDRTWS
jgi:gluconate/galactonate dehydratase